MRLVRAVWLISFTLLSQGCVSDVANRYYGSTKFPPRPVDEVEVLSAPPARPYDVIADFQSKGESSGSLQRKAAKIGADAIIVTPLGGNVPIASEWAGDRTYRAPFNERIVGTAVRYK